MAGERVYVFYLRDLLVAEREPGTSGSGATFLHEWLMVHDPNSESLLREPLRSGE